jgi:hypothetical protein
MIGTECMGCGGDKLVQVGYVFITLLLRYSEPKQFDEFISQMLTPLLEIERQIVVNALQYIQGANIERERVLIERRDQLNTVIKYQTPFDPKRMLPNKHI